jgi:fructokinase
VGIGMPGAISPATGRVKNANSTWLNDRPLADDLGQRLPRPLRFANDANCFALSEARDGAGAGARAVFGVIAGTGVGGGLVLDGGVWTGPNAVAGEWGHNPLPWPQADEWPGPACYCGKTGCIETFLSGPGLAQDHRRVTGETAEATVILRTRRSAGTWTRLPRWTATRTVWPGPWPASSTSWTRTSSSWAAGCRTSAGSIRA